MSTQPSSPFGPLLRHYRLAAGLTEEALAERARLSVAAIYTLERGSRRAPRKARLALLAEALALTASEREALEAVARQSGLAAPSMPGQDAFLPPTNSPSWPVVGRAQELAVLEGIWPATARLCCSWPGSQGLARVACSRKRRDSPPSEAGRCWRAGVSAAVGRNPTRRW